MGDESSSESNDVQLYLFRRSNFCLLLLFQCSFICWFQANHKKVILTSLNPFSQPFLVSKESRFRKKERSQQLGKIFFLKMTIQKNQIKLFILYKKNNASQIQELQVQSRSRKKMAVVHDMVVGLQKGHKVTKNVQPVRQNRKKGVNTAKVRLALEFINLILKLERLRPRSRPRSHGPLSLRATRNWIAPNLKG